MTAPSPLSQWARLLLESFRQAGIRDVVISPGSRSTPWVWAALHTEGLECHHVLDERSAGFFAVGQAKVSGRPSLLVCTSGTAAAHYLPAVIEADATCTPLVVLTADRPFELQYCAAPQTIDQTRLFGDFARYFELGMPDVQALRFARRLAFQATGSTRLGASSVSHVNARARKPLEPAPCPELERQVTELLREPPPALHAPRLVPEPPRALEAAIAEGRTGLLFAGPELPAQADYTHELLELSVRTGWPIVADAASPVRWVAEELQANQAQILGATEWYLRAAARPEVALAFGMPMVPTALDRWFEQDAPSSLYRVSRGAFRDPTNRAAQILGEPASLCAQLASLRQEPSPAAKAYATQLLEHEERAWAVVGQALARDSEFTELHAVRQIARALPRGSLLGLGNSLPIRDFGACVPPTGSSLALWSQRGANGIDGNVSSIAGAASQACCPTTLVLGDLSFLHDLGGLWACRGITHPLLLVVLDNAGGRIFEQLPLMKTAANTMEPVAAGTAARTKRASAPAEPVLQSWLFSHQLPLENAGTLFGLPSCTVDDAASLNSALERAYGTPGASVIIVRVTPSGASQLLERIRHDLGRA